MLKTKLKEMKMSKISVTIGLNVKLKNSGNREDNFDRFTSSITISDIDTEVDIKKQLDAAIKGTEKVFEATAACMEECVEKELERDPMK